MKIHNKIILLLLGIFFTYTLLFSGFIYYSISNYAFTDFYKRLEIRAASIAKIKLDNSNDVSSIREVHDDFLEKLPSQKEYMFRVVDGKAEAAAYQGELPKHFIQDLIEDQAAKYSKGNKFYSGILYETTLGAKYLVIVGADNYFYAHHIAYLRNLILTSLMFAILILVIISILISRTLTRPVNNIISEVKEISSENLHLRLKTSDNNDSLSGLTSTFNDMLNRLETSFETQKNFISNASHELNTPLTSIIGEAELALSKPRDGEEYKTSISKILEEAEMLDKKTKALLFLAQTGYNGKAQKFDKVRIDQLILDIKETVHNINANYQIKIDYSLLPESPEKLKVKGNEQLLHLALSNIIINGCKYSEANQVQVGLAASDKDVIIVVRDTGIGIPEDEMQYIYDPYFRASNTGDFEGYGIGLPLSRNIIQMHDGRLIVNSVLEKGTTVQVNLPIGGYSL
ncbi:HAMP domain-containing sensor histidine kinase [Limibacter armeniacum]|uniref:HAMP domain-containing sensor histidine kinase n=1 Tax=Limibacter armeniacum TaxID=466084 RepID=UPI002FE6B0B4